MSVTIVGLGPGRAQMLTEEAKAALANAGELYVLTRLHPVAAGLDAEIRSFDDAGDSEEIAAMLADAAKTQNIIYAVPGHPLVGNATVAMLLERCRRDGIEFRIVSGVSQVEAVCATLGTNAAASGLQIAEASSPMLNPARPGLIVGLAEAGNPPGLEAVLLHLYPADHQVTVVDAGGSQAPYSLAIADLESLGEITYATCLYIPPLELTRNLRTLDGLSRIVTYLRGPDGCPWDKAQSHASLKPFLLEETYEALEALDINDPAKMREEFGDVLFEVLLQAQVAADDGEFDLSDVVYGIAAKLVRRHPHVFGDEAASTAKDVEQRWDVLKRAEHGAEHSALASVPTIMPALAYSQALLSRAARAGFQWPGLDNVLEKLREEIAEMAAAVTPEQKREEFGDILINLVNAARYVDIDAEDALRMAAQKFRNRFMMVESLAKEADRSLEEMDIAEMQSLWAQAKKVPSD